MSMATLLKSNPYLQDRALRQRMISQSVRESSILEGARGLQPDTRKKQTSIPLKKKP